MHEIYNISIYIMQFTQSHTVPTVCLNMIVKNEAHIIRQTLQMLLTKIRFDYWVICDTGSTDATREIIQDFLKNVPGELYCNDWVDFAHNRTKALEYAFNKTDLLLVFDADDDIQGTVTMPSAVTHDEYHLKFGAPKFGTNYTRTLLINNRKRFKYFSVIHEYISCLEPNEQTRMCVLEGDYYVVSGRSGARNQDPDKYLKDALLLEKAHAEALAQGDDLYKRYAFYCANSYRDCGKHEDAIRWYKITLAQDNWAQEKYVACLYAYECYEALGQKEHGLFYLVKAFAYDRERVECLYPLLVHYCCEGMNEVAYNYYRMVENQFIRINNANNANNATNGKLFLQTDKTNFFVPYYMIIVADRVGDRECGILMYEIIFKQKQYVFSEWHLRNLMFNLRFFIGHVKPDALNAFVALAKNYMQFLIMKGLPVSTFDDLVQSLPITTMPPPSGLIVSPNFSRSECKRRRNILFYTGYSNVLWNYSSMKRGALGGSEKAVAHLSKELSLRSCGCDDYTIYVAGSVQSEKLSGNNLKYVGLSDLPELLRTTAFHTIICSRYISFLELYGGIASWYQFYIWAHDTHLIPYGCDLSDTAIVEKWSAHIDGCVCQTQWHADEYVRQYPVLKSKIHIINNGIDPELFPPLRLAKKSGKFIYTSRTERGLARILDLWPDIVSAIPDATLVISTYVAFPCNDDERHIQNRIAHLNRDTESIRIRHLGQLNPAQLYEEMGEAEYWLYPTDWPETSCITAMEMLMSEVIGVYYPVAGLTETMGGCGIQVGPGSEIQALMAHDEGAKEALRKQGRAYAETCSWANRAKQWGTLLQVNELNNHRKQNESILFFLPFWYNALDLQDYLDGFRTIYKTVIQTSDTAYAIDTINSDPTIRTVMFAYEVSSEDVYDHCTHVNGANIEMCILNTEPLNLLHRLQNLKMYLTKYDGIPIYDYSLSNIRILNDAGFENTHHLPYIIYPAEQDALTALNAQTEKTHDFGIISDPIMLERRSMVVAYLIEQGYTVNVISGFKHERDAQVASCRVLLNIHGSNCGEESKIFEHIRCDRLLTAGYRILSEECIHLDPAFVKAHTRNLKLIPYSDFFVADAIAACVLQLKPKPMKIIDCFIFYNELEMLAYRLHALHQIVDYFIIVEARQTFIGADKPLHFEENKHQPRFAQYSDKIIHIVVDMPHSQRGGNMDILQDDQWTNERFQRNCISQGIEKIAAHLNDHDAIIIADLDEIPDPNTLAKIKTDGRSGHHLLPLGIYSLEQDFYYYNLNSKRNEKWYHCKILTFKKYKDLNTSCESIRFFNCKSIAMGGWHLSYFGDSHFIKNKLENFAHQEYNSEQYTDLGQIQKRMEGCVDLFNRGTCINQMHHVSIYDNEYLPPFYKTHLSSFFSETEQTGNKNC